MYIVVNVFVINIENRFINILFSGRYRLVKIVAMLSNGQERRNFIVYAVKDKKCNVGGAVKISVPSYNRRSLTVSDCRRERRVYQASYCLTF